MPGEFVVNPGGLGGLERTVGFLLSLGATVVGTWVIARNQTTSPAEDFAQARRIAIVATAILTALMFVFLAGPKRFMELGVIAAGALAACFVFFLWNVATAFSARRGRTIVVVTYLATFIIYATSGSVALSAASLLLYVADPTGEKNPASAVDEGPLVAPAVSGAGPMPRTEPTVRAPTVPVVRSSDAAAAAALVAAPTPTNLAGRIERAAVSYEVRKFEVSSGQLNVGCEETRPARASFPLPDRAEIVGTLSASWRNTANARSFSASTRQVGANEVVAEGALVGLEREHILGMANCPGGGHGELVLSGSYRQLRREP